MWQLFFKKRRDTRTVNDKDLLLAIRSDYESYKKGTLPTDKAYKLYAAVQVIYKMGDVSAQRSFYNFIDTLKTAHPEVWDFLNKK